ncbi:MAG TPA: flagellar filament capping protein FliD [Chthonomonadaceae bacterium]|nr:flagellar filament capping protein FliD [Chthonomonadaceae bacterium]
MSVSGVNFSGLASGLDSTSIINATVTAARQPETIWKNNITNLQNKQTAYNSVSAQLLQFQTTAQTIDGLRSFNLVTATSSATDVATVSAATGSQPGSHDLTVTNLAKAEKVAATAQTSATAPLGYSGQILVNGKAINVAAGDSLQVLAGNINSANAGVNASIISPSANQFILTLASTSTGIQGKPSLSDTAGGTLLSSTLGLFSSGAALRHVVSGTTVGSDLFADSATSVATLQGQTAIPPTTGAVSITSGGTTKSVTIDLSKSLGGIASDINAAFGSSVASVATVTDPISGGSKQQLQLSGIAGSGALVDNNNVLANLGLIQRTYATGVETQAAQDANFTIDGIAGSRPTNTITDVISGVTIGLLRDGSTGTPATTTLSVGSDTATIKSNIQAYVKSFNDTIDLISNQSQFDPTTGNTGVLFGDSTTSTIVDSLVSQATSQVQGLPSSLSAISQIGITLDQTNHLNIDDAALTQALTDNLQGVAKLFQSNGQPTDSSVQFVSGTGDTQPTTGSGYAVAITQPAQQAVVTASNVLAGGLGQDETLTFTGSLLGTIAGSAGGYQLTLPQGSTVDGIVSLLNADKTLSPILSAANVGGKLTLTTKSYGSLAELAVQSNVDSSTANSTGIGTALVDQKGQDVAGTINGEVATGTGQFLLGSQAGGNGIAKGQALGLQLRVTATAPGSYGTITFSSGVADQLKNYVNTQTDGFTGALTTSAQGLQDSIDDNKKNISDLEASITTMQADLQQQYATLESTISQIKSTSTSIGQIGR